MKATTKSANGTSFHGTTVIASVNELTAVLGQPQYSGNDGEDKTNFEWTMETESGDVFTVYDWKEYRRLTKTERIVWHIGGNSAATTAEAANEIQESLNN